MKILFLSMEYPPKTGGGGIGSYLSVICPALVKRGHEVHVLSCVGGQREEDERDGQVWIHRRGQGSVRGLRSLLRSRSAAARLSLALSCWREHRRLGLDFDVVEAPDWGGEGFLFALTKTRPLVTHLHGPLHVIARYSGEDGDWDTRLGSLVERTVVRRADTLASPSELLVRELTSEGWLQKQARVVSYPVDIDRWQGVPSSRDTAPVVMQVGRIERAKAPEVLIDATALLAKEVDNVEAVFVGRSNGERDGVPYERWVRERARSAGAPCRFVGQVRQDELPAVLAAARVVAVPSRFDSFSIAGLEAMAAGRPVVCTETTGIAEILRPGTGRVVRTGDATALADALRPYLVDPGLAASEGTAARAVVTEKCNPERIAELREACYVEAISVWEARSGKWRRRERHPS